MVYMNFFEKINSYIRSDKGHDVALATIIVAVGIVSFYLGRLSLQNELGVVADSNGTASVVTVPLETKTSTKVLTNSPVKNISGNVKKSDEKNIDPIPSDVQKEGSYVASKNGTKYYALSCSGVSRIKEENKVYFNSQSEAESAGYSKSETCKNY